MMNKWTNFCCCFFVFPLWNQWFLPPLSATQLLISWRSGKMTEAVDRQTFSLARGAPAITLESLTSAVCSAESWSRVHVTVFTRAENQASLFFSPPAYSLGRGVLCLLDMYFFHKPVYRLWPKFNVPQCLQPPESGSWLPHPPSSHSPTQQRTSCCGFYDAFNWFCLFVVCCIFLFAVFKEDSSWSRMNSQKVGTDCATVFFQAEPRPRHTADTPPTAAESNGLKQTLPF